METGTALKYNTSVISEEEFKTLNSLVLSVFDLGRQWYKPELVCISNNWDDMPEPHRSERKDSDCLGVSMAAEGMHHDEFSIWLNPSWRAPAQFKFYQLLAHELCHGYVGLQYDHTPAWRRWYYRTVWHLHQAKMIPEPEDELKFNCVMTEMYYNKIPKVDPMLSVLEAFSQAEREHNKVMDNYVARIACA